MKEYISPEVELVEFVTEMVTAEQSFTPGVGTEDPE